MKKNKAMRLAAALLVLTLLTTSMISGTFAKYTTQDAANDSARVAKWGVELQAVGGLFGDTYIDEQVRNTSGKITVQAADATSTTEGSDVVAPGTESATGFSFSLAGKPEVAGTVTTTMKVQNIFLAAGTYGLMLPVYTNITEGNFSEFGDLYYKEGNSYIKATAYVSGKSYYTLEDEVTTDQPYYPVVYRLIGETEYKTGSTSADSLKAAADAIAASMGLTAGTAAADTSVTYTGKNAFDANTDLALQYKCVELLSWAWAYGDTTKVGDSADVSDKADTILGLLENTTDGEVVKLSGTSYVAPVEYTDYCLETQFSIDITVTQAD